MEEYTLAAIGLKPESEEQSASQSQKIEIRDFLYKLSEKGVNYLSLDEDDDKHDMGKYNKSIRKASGPQDIDSTLNYDSTLAERKLSLEDEDTENNNQVSEITKVKRVLEVIKTEKYKFIGYTLNNLRDGFGVCYYANGAIHIGEFKRGKKFGYGKTIFANGEVILGELKNNYYDGFCELSNLKENIFVLGECKKGKYLNEIVIQKDKKSIEGIDITNLSNKTLCRINYSPINYFIGEIDCTDPKLETGFGIIVHKKSYVYMGHFKNGKFNGYGEFYKSNGSKYFGNYNNHLKQNLGFYFNKEFMGFGNFSNNLKHGPFYLVRKNAIRVELYFLGLSSKIIEKVDTIKKYINLYYPEYKYILHPNLAGLLNKLSVLNENQEILAELISEKAKNKEAKIEETPNEINTEVQK